MRPQTEAMYSQFDSFEIGAAMRRPIQCEGIKRGPERIADVAASGSVSPQFDWGGLIKNVGGSLLNLL
jgi:hypothetical protein